MSSSTTRAFVDWSSLRADALEEISDRLTFNPDYVRFRSVCSGWRSATPKRSLAPWLIGHRKDSDGKFPLLTFHRLDSGPHHFSPIPGIPGSPLIAGMLCCGSSRGWMVLLDTAGLIGFAGPSIILFNPITSSQIRLPQLQLSSKEKEHLLILERNFSGSLTPTGFKVRAHYRVTRLILSADPSESPADYAALLIFCEGRIALWRAGDGDWVRVGGRHRGIVADSAFYEGRFHLSTQEGNLYVCGPHKHPRLRKIKSTSWDSHGDARMLGSRLVVSDGNLLLVLAYCNEGSRLAIFKVELGAELEEAKLVRLEDLGDKALFLGRNHSFSVSADQVPGCLGNRIYYTGIACAPWPEPCNKITVYDFKDNITEFLPSDAALPQPDWKPCAWFMPNSLPCSLETST